MKYASKSQTSARGFTLIELLVVVAIIGILAGVAVGNYRHAITKAKEAVLKENLFTMRSSINQYFADKGHYPNDLRTLVDAHYIRAMPIDPITGADDTWDTIHAQMGDEDISTEPGIEDVRSGSAGIALDGSRYSDW